MKHQQIIKGAEGMAQRSGEPAIRARAHANRAAWGRNQEIIGNHGALRRSNMFIPMIPAMNQLSHQFGQRLERRDDPAMRHLDNGSSSDAQIVTRPESRFLQRKCSCGSHSGATGECAECGKKRKLLQRHGGKSRFQNDFFVPPIVHEVLRSSGQPLDQATLAFMEPRFGHDFSQVRVHNDAQAAASARAVSAFAYTVGNHIVFGSGQQTMSGPVGQRLIAHELTHVIQQGKSNRILDRSYNQPLSAIRTSAPMLSRVKYPGTFARCRGMGVPCQTILIYQGTAGPLMDCYRAKTANLPFAISPGVCIYDMSDGRICSCVLVGTSSFAACVFITCDSRGISGLMSTEAIGEAALAAYQEQSQGDEPAQDTEEMQAKLAVGNSTDPLELEADRVAERVMRMPDSTGAAYDVPFEANFTVNPRAKRFRF